MESTSGAHKAPLKHTPLNALHKQFGARMVPFSGYQMPVQYKAGIIKEHNHVRQVAGLFDVSHMGQAIIHGENPALNFEKLISCLLYTSPSPRDRTRSRMPSSA